ncbi:DUF1420 family protein [Candidatus Pelagibacter sp. Uisw_127]|uniref:DUF1420 family protein n=1 Tax=Candidatus Pelagibacter sp. Uisw_127 TaxID=3230988 RepID=UPI0039E9FC3B
MNSLINPTIQPLLQTLITFILCSGILNIGRLINKNFFKNYNYYFFDLSIATIFLSQIIFIFFVFGFFKEIIIISSYILIFFGIINVDIFKKIKILFKSFIKKKIDIFKILILVILLCFLIISIGPPSMADALDYHFGVPLYLLNYLKLPNQDIWLHGSLFGNGELFNAIGLYLNSDNFFTFFQFLALVLFFEFLKNKEKDNSKLNFLFFFIISSPVILFLISGPKPLLFPQLLTTAALYIFIKEKKFKIENILLIGILLMGSAQYKLSFILSCTVLGLLVLAQTFKNDKKATSYLFLLLILFFLPKSIYNFNQVSEFGLINIFTTLPDNFLNNLSNFRDNDFFYPFNLFIPNSFGSITTILGFQLLLLIFIKKITKEFKLILIITFLTIALHFIFGQQTAKIYFEFLLWIGIGFYFLNKKYFNYKFFTYFLIPQFILVIIVSFYFATVSFVTLISLDKRDKFMKKNSFEYEAIKWSNNQISSNDVIISELRSNVFFANEVIPLESSENILRFLKTKEYVEYLKQKNPKFIVSYKNNFNDHFLAECIGSVYKTSDIFEKSSRNPFNTGEKYKIYIYHFNSDKLNYCTNFK